MSSRIMLVTFLILSLMSSGLCDKKNKKEERSKSSTSSTTVTEEPSTTSTTTVTEGPTMCHRGSIVCNMCHGCDVDLLSRIPFIFQWMCHSKCMISAIFY